MDGGGEGDLLASSIFPSMDVLLASLLSMSPLPATSSLPSLPALLRTVLPQSDLKTISEPESLLDSAGVEPGGAGSKPELSQDSTAESTEGMAGPKRPNQSLWPKSSLVTPGFLGREILRVTVSPEFCSMRMASLSGFPRSDTPLMASSRSPT